VLAAEPPAPRRPGRLAALVRSVMPLRPRLRPVEQS
jgi:hypothetical protein